MSQGRHSTAHPPSMHSNQLAGRLNQLDPAYTLRWNAVHLRRIFSMLMLQHFMLSTACAQTAGHHALALTVANLTPIKINIFHSIQSSSIGHAAYGARRFRTTCTNGRAPQSSCRLDCSTPDCAHVSYVVNQTVPGWHSDRDAHAAESFSQGTALTSGPCSSQCFLSRLSYCSSAFCTTEPRAATPDSRCARYKQRLCPDHAAQIASSAAHLLRQRLCAAVSGGPA
jgi:hypothetical protein